MKVYGIRFVIHAIAPTKDEGMKKTPLVDTVKKALDEAEYLKCQTVAFPAICSGWLGQIADEFFVTSSLS